ncbi:MAG TPA: circadian clock protein KaiC [Chthoniobacterales bacterium]
MKKAVRPLCPQPLTKSPTGIRGLDEITGGGLPTGRVTLVCGGAGCGKTLLATEFLVNGATQYHEPGVLMAFEESAEELTQNVASLGFDLRQLEADKLLSVDNVFVDRTEFEESGAYDLEGLFIRLGYAIDSIAAKRVVLDTIEVLFSGLPKPAIVRAELQRLFRWLKDKGVTTILTGEKGEGTLTRYGLEEYVSDCVISLDHRVVDQASTRRMRVIKYRGSAHGSNEYPFLIDNDGLSVWPLTSLTLDHPASRERVSTGVERLDTMLGGEGYYRGSTILVSGTAGTGKTSLAATIANETCRRRERCLFFSFEESPDQVLRNMHSIGLDLQQWIAQRRLRFCAARPTSKGLETHLARMMKETTEFAPAVVIVDPISSLMQSGNATSVQGTMLRLIDFLKAKGITAVLNSLSLPGTGLPPADASIASLVDTWLVVRDRELNGERNRVLDVVKSRGMAHSNQVREFLLTNAGITLNDVYLGADGPLTGSARLTQKAREQAEQTARKEEIKRQQLVVESKRCLLDTQIAALRVGFATDETDLKRLLRDEEAHAGHEASNSVEMAKSRQADTVSPGQQRRLKKNQQPAG